MKKSVISVLCAGMMIAAAVGCQANSGSSADTGNTASAQTSDTGNTASVQTSDTGSTASAAATADFRMTIGNEPVTTATEKIEYVVSYHGDDPDMKLRYGAKTTLEKLCADGSWKNMDPGAEYILIAYESPLPMFTGGYNLTNISEPLTAGRYRLSKEINGGIVVSAEFDIIEAAGQTTSSATVTEPFAPDETEEAFVPEETVEPFAPDETEETFEPDETEEPPELPSPDEYDIMLRIEEGSELTSNNKAFTLAVDYVGSAENVEYCFGSGYTLYRWDDFLIDWAEVEFGENSAFDALGHIVGSSSPHNSVTVALYDEFYAKPLEAGSYRVDIVIDGVTFSEFFEYKLTDSETGLVIDSDEGSITLVINEIQSDRFVCELPWPYPASYEVMCDTAQFDGLCVNDTIEVAYAPMYKVEEYLYRLTPTDISMSDFELQAGADYKPVIYLYPEQETEVSVQLDYNGTLTITEPYYGDGWRVTAHPDGTITAADGSVYPYLFWEGVRDFDYDITEGFCVSGADTEAFLKEKLAYLGLSDSEAAEFCEFWLPHMEKNAYNIITFRGEDYTDNAMLDISPKPDTVIRVFMTFAPSDQPVQIAVQQLEKAPQRSGFTVVEWGGTML